MNNIADYDTLNYDYRQYWKNREYENISEIEVLKKLLKDAHGEWFIDIGGSYGRLTSQYYEKYKNCIILDYSLKTLQDNFKYIKKNFPNTLPICANAYKLPFKDSVFDGGLMVRVLHHLERAQEYFDEAHRVLNSDSVYIQEYANKKHIKAVIKSILKLDFSVFSKEPYQQPTKQNYEGARKGSYVPFFNYHPEWVKDSLRKSGLKILNTVGCSFFRVNILKRVLGIKILILFEKISQKVLSWTNISPSIFVKCTTEKKERKEYKELKDILQCPQCSGELNIQESKAKCAKCQREYLKKDNIWDFRV